MAYCVKITSFVVGGTFFLCWPIASIWPKYRYLVSPIKWVLWDIPTDGKDTVRCLMTITNTESPSGMVVQSFEAASADKS